MKLSLSTNWCNRRYSSGEEIVDKALSLGIDELELGFHTSKEQVAGFKKCSAKISIGSVHAFCPVPIGAPGGYPELYSLASFDESMRLLARTHVKKNIAFAAEMGADTLVLHAGRVAFSGLFEVLDSSVLRQTLEKSRGDTSARGYRKLLSSALALRVRRGRKMLELFSKELEALIPDLERYGVTIALENLPYLEGFPNEDEMVELRSRFANVPVKAWFDTGHDRVRYMHAWTDCSTMRLMERVEDFQGMHLNDVVDFNDDHLPPGDGKVDFVALKPFAKRMRHIVLEPSGAVSDESLRKGIEYIRKVWEI